MNLLNEIISAEEIKEMVGTSKLKCGVQVQINRMILRLAETYNPDKPEGYYFSYKHSASELFNDGKLEKATYNVMLSFK